MDYSIKKVYSFSVYPTTILGNNFQNVTVLAIMDRDSANQLIDTQAMHINMFPSLPAGTPNDPNAYNYLKIRTASGEVTVIGEAWINESTVQEISSTTITAVIGNVAPSDVNRIRAALTQNGFTSVTLSVS